MIGATTPASNIGQNLIALAYTAPAGPVLQRHGAHHDPGAGQTDPLPGAAGPGFKASLMQQRSRAAFAQSLDVFAEVDQGVYEAEPRTPETTTPTTFRQWCEEMFRPAVGGSS